MRKEPHCDTCTCYHYQDYKILGAVSHKITPEAEKAFASTRKMIKEFKRDLYKTVGNVDKKHKD